MFSANYTLPEEGEESPFKEIIFTELQREEAAKIVEEYNKVSVIISKPLFRLAGLSVRP